MQLNEATNMLLKKLEKESISYGHYKLILVSLWIASCGFIFYGTYLSWGRGIALIVLGLMLALTTALAFFVFQNEERADIIKMALKNQIADRNENATN